MNPYQQVPVPAGWFWLSGGLRWSYSLIKYPIWTNMNKSFYPWQRAPGNLCMSLLHIVQWWHNKDDHVFSTCKSFPGDEARFQLPQRKYGLFFVWECALLSPGPQLLLGGRPDILCELIKLKNLNVYAYFCKYQILYPEMYNRGI